MAAVELTRAELALLVEALRPMTEERDRSFANSLAASVRAIDARALSDKLEKALGPHLRPVA